MAIKSCCCGFSNLKIVDFQDGNHILRNTQIAPDRTVFIKIFPGGACTQTPPLFIVTGLPMHLLCNPLIRY